MANICVITAVKPNMYNEGGGPSGLIWEVIDFLQKHYEGVDVKIVPQATSGIVALAQRYGYLRPSLQLDLSDYDYLLVYPDGVFWTLPQNVRGQAVVLGPDSPSWRDLRPYVRSHGWLKIVKGIEVCLARHREARLLREAKNVLLVGRTDQLCMRRNPLLYQDRELQSKCLFLCHPVLTKVVQELQMPSDTMRKRKRFVFSGNMVNRYAEPFFMQLFQALEQKNCVQEECLHILVTGRDNESVANRFKELSFCQTEYLPWVEKYSDICILGQDVHCLPLVIGAGTKNRVLTALAMGLEVITTPIGIENVHFKGLKGVCITPRPDKFADYMWQANSPMRNEELQALLIERRKFRERVTQECSKTLIACFGEVSKSKGD